MHIWLSILIYICILNFKSIGNTLVLGHGWPGIGQGQSQGRNSLIALCPYDPA